MQADLYYFLLQECNIRKWENPFSVDNGTVATALGITENSLIKAREVLVELNLIGYVPGITKKKSPEYCINHYPSDYRNKKSNPGGNRRGNKKGNNSDYPSDYRNKKSNPGGIEANIYNKPNKTKLSSSTSTTTADVPSALLQENFLNGKKIEPPPAPPPEPAKPPKAPKDEKPEPFWEVLKKVWLDFYFQEFKAMPTFDAAAAKNFKLILGKIKKMPTVEGKTWNEEFAKKCLLVFLFKAIKKGWLKENFLLENLNKKFDSIVNSKSDETNKHTTTAAVGRNMEFD